VKTGKPWRGIVKNRCKNGDHYWVDAYVTPVYEEGRVVGYQSVRSKPQRAQVTAAERLYQKLNQSQVERLKKPWRVADLPIDGKALAAFMALGMLALLIGVAALMGLHDKEAQFHSWVGDIEARTQRVEEIWRQQQGQGPLAAQMNAELEQLAVEVRGQHAAVEPATYGVIAAAMGLALMLALWLSWLNRRMFTVPLLRAMVTTKAIASGDLTQRVEVHNNDELGQVLQAVKMMQARLQTLIGRIAESTGMLAANASEVATVAQQSSVSMSQQRSETDMVATAMNEMSSAVQEVALHAERAAGAASEASDAVGEGRAVVAEVVSQINDLAREVEAAGTAMARLEEKSEKIGSILDVIRGIAEQTNLLALNAAIEAARAGEQGRGFAVVADEVRTLAQRTQQSTREIQQMIEGLQGEARDAAGLMRRGRGQAQGSVEQVARAAAALGTISDKIHLINDLNTQIATAAEQQTTVSEEINRNLSGIATAALQTSEGAERTALCCEELEQRSAQLSQLVAQFKLS